MCQDPVGANLKPESFILNSCSFSLGLANLSDVSVLNTAVSVSKPLVEERMEGRVMGINDEGR